MKLNLGCGHHTIEGFVNVDKCGKPDLLCDLEDLPWPWKDNSVSEVLFNHSLEHMGETSGKFLGIMKELYRVCRSEATVHINAPYPRHDNYMIDPTHVRMINPHMLIMFSRKENERVIRENLANSTLGMDIGVDFEMLSISIDVDENFSNRIPPGKQTIEDILNLCSVYNNLIKEFRIILNVVKSS